MITEIVGRRIKALRTEQNISQEKLALKADLDRTYIAGVESGKRNLSLKSLDKIITALGISYKEFFIDMWCWLWVTYSVTFKEVIICSTLMKI